MTPTPEALEAARNEDRVAELGRVTWHTSEEGGPPDVGISIGLGNDRMLWCGEVTDRCFEDADEDASVFGGAAGWWLVLYRKNQSQVLAKFPHSEAAHDFAEILTAALTDFAARAVEGEQPDPLTDAAGQKAIRIGTLFGGLLSSSALGRLEVMVAKAIRDAVEGEREACAMLVENADSLWDSSESERSYRMNEDIAVTIRARTKEQP